MGTIWERFLEVSGLEHSGSSVLEVTMFHTST